jgi:hypothetical protein
MNRQIICSLGLLGLMCLSRPAAAQCRPGDTGAAGEACTYYMLNGCLAGDQKEIPGYTAGCESCERKLIHDGTECILLLLPADL